jgi:predicted S18 family serine protease
MGAILSVQVMVHSHLAGVCGNISFTSTGGEQSMMNSVFPAKQTYKFRCENNVHHNSQTVM